MAWTITGDLDAFRTQADALLRARPDRNTVLLTVSTALAGLGMDLYGHTPPWFGWWRTADGRVGGAVLCTPPHPAVLSAMPEAAAVQLSVTLAERDPVPPGVNGPATVTEAFAATYGPLVGADTRVLRNERLFRLGTLRPPRPAHPGRDRPATEADRDLLVAWGAAFRRDVGLRPADDRRMMEDRIRAGRITLWETASGPVAMASMGAPAAGTIRIGPVYTPRRHRGRGYGAAATAARSQAALNAGVGDVLLFTDLANPTSNALYRRLGYRPLGDYTSYEFAR
ncbi:hypothetical protein N566_11710 [Streptomycetaceae bacterium MP113-05]|nr:hypothetical protein N566_11710 [Streptomycetaceae bacterium MP113-05]